MPAMWRELDVTHSQTAEHKHRTSHALYRDVQSVDNLSGKLTDGSSLYFVAS